MNKIILGHELQLLHKTYGLYTYICVKCNSHIQSFLRSNSKHEYYIYGINYFRDLDLTCDEVIIKNIIE